MSADAPTPLPRMLLDLHREGFGGWLALHRGAQERRIEWREGAPVRLESSAPDEAPGAVLVARGLLREADRERARHEAQRRGTAEVAAIAGLQLVPPRELLLALRAQLQELLVAACGWPDAGVDVQPGPAAGPPLPVPPLDVVAVVAEGVGRHWSAAAVEKALGTRAGAYLAATERAAAWRPRFDAEGAERLFTLLDGRRRGAELLAALDDRRARAALFVLHALGGLTAHEAPPDDGAQAPDDAAPEEGPEIEVVVAGADAEAGAAAGGAGASAGDDGAAELAPEAAALRDEIVELHGRLGEIDHYALLGVARDAKAAQIKKAYLKAAKRLHPDRLARMELGAYKEQANDVFARITEAHTVLGDPEQRRRYDEGGSDPADAEAGRLAQAEALFLKAEMMMRAGNFLGALEYLETVVELWPEEAAYQAALAWTLFKKNPPELERSLDVFEKAMALDDRDAVAWLRLGIVRKQAGDAAGAKQATERGRALDPAAKP
jgi:DnaJ-domain-containing protein 1